MIRLVARNVDGTMVTAGKLLIACLPAGLATHEIQEGNGRTVEIRGNKRLAVL